MKTKTILILLIAFCATRGDITTVTVPQAMVHVPNAAMGLGFTGKVDYLLAPLTNDSVFVTLSIEPQAGGAALALTKVSGDVGVIFVNLNMPSTARKYSIYFEAASPQPGVPYVAKITANAIVSTMQSDAQTKISSMTSSQKAILFGGDGSMQGNGAGSIPIIYMADGPHGVRGNGNATAFATCAGEACTWDTALARQQGQAKGEEFRGLGRNCSLGPALDLVYHPQGGRASEYYAEDPYLSGRMAAADVLGIQSRGCIATIKHYACNNMELNRGQMSANMSERSLRELYLYNWKPCVVEGQCWGIMNAYNRVNGSYAGSNKYIQTDVLRNEWGYKFLVMTDWGANFDNLNQGMQYGSDIDMPSPDTYTSGGVTGQSQAIIDKHALRIALAHEMLGDMKPGYNRTAYGANTAAHVQTVRDVGAAGIVLARNTGNILPLPKTGKKIAVTGPFRNQCRLGPGGSSAVSPAATARINPLQGITQLLAGVGAGASTVQDNNITGADYIIVFVGVTSEAEGGDRPYLQVTDATNNTPDGGDENVATALASPNGQAKTIVVFTGGSAAIAGNWSKANAILIAFYPGQEQGHSLADVLFGNVNPSGKLPVTFPQDGTQLPNWTLSNNILNYPASDVAHGYFRVNKNNQTPLFAFGHGLSYTTFAYSNLQVYPATIAAGDRVHVSLTVSNTGAVAGKEVVELYLSMPTGGALPVRVQDLRGFTKVSLAPGANTQVNFTLTQEEMQVFNPNGADYNGSGTWQVLTGTYGVRVGTSSQRDLQPTVSGSFVVQ